MLKDLNMEKKQLCAIFFYDLKLGHKAGQAFGEGSTNERLLQG